MATFVRTSGCAADEITMATAHPARMYDYLLGGKDNYPADRIVAEQVLRAAPEARLMARENRRFLHRAVRFLVAEAGIRQIIDIGTGIPAADNVHQTAQKVTPDVRVVYVDNDPLVHAHANALLTGTGRTAAVLADLREPHKILDHPRVRHLIDFTEPVALLLVAVVHFIRDEEDPAGIVRTLLDALPVGSYLALSHATGDLRPITAAQVTEAYDAATSPLTVRSHSAIAVFFNGCDLVDPGLVQVPTWQPDGKRPKGYRNIWIYGGVGKRI
ncbi:SAM-dependent methyltransferase [Candidatus Protofrankia californiensis]|uniref:SAM-dependent methyltransferase n=1 Tax=Candidatus Protofrankia californiensis TaxID=1839754 RepID=UPI0010414855|nr:SAM-dependent methyltransferase [Candidatus Protofrankia californiensis]